MFLLRVTLPRRAASLAFAGVLAFAAFMLGNASDVRLGAAPAPDHAAGLRAFADVASVLRHPRCLNCHPAGNTPHQTDRQLVHFPPVQRGPDDHGVIGMRCNACHQSENQANGLPGAPHWGLAPRVMAWEGVDDHALAEQLKDRARNGGRNLAQLIEHIEAEPLVLWSWQPGGVRRTPPLSHAEFVQRFKDWVAAGAPSPERTTP